MKKIINSQLFLLTKKTNIPGITRSILKKFLPFGVLLFGLIISSFLNPIAHKKNYSNEKAKENETSKMVKRENREENRMIRALESISPETMSLMARQFPNAKNVSWTITAGFAEADFTSGGSNRMAFYDFDNKLVGTGKYISYKDLPAESFKKIDRYFKDYTPEKVIYYDDNELNENDLSLFGTTLDRDGYYALMKDNNSNKKIVLQISPEGEVTFLTDFR